MRNKSGVKSERENPSESNVISQYQGGEVSKLGVFWHDTWKLSLRLKIGQVAEKYRR